MAHSNSAQIEPIQATVTAEVPYPEISRVSLSDAYSAYENKAAIFIDVRSLENYSQSHISGAVSLPLDQIEAQIPSLDFQAWIIPYCT